jgi:DNA-directed RNA polymerase subunit RPC12/RpoP
MTREKIDIKDIRVVCAMCGRHLKGNRKAKKVSHSYCDYCGDKVTKQIEEYKAK